LYNETERSDAYKNRLIDFIRSEYMINPISIKPAKRGYFGETWQLESGEKQFFLKLDYTALHGPIYENSFHIIEHLCRHGIDFVSKIIKTADGRLFTHFDSAVLGVFDWIDGENVQNKHTKIQEYEMLAKIYTVPPNNIFIPKETFSTISADLFYAEWKRLKVAARDKTTKQLLTLFDQNELKIKHRAERLELFASRCDTNTSHFYITHGDAGGNLIVDDDKFYIIDWDEPRYAPPERDAWFCLHWNWAMDAFHGALHQNGINYTLRPERLAYYCYHMFFNYMVEYLTTYTTRDCKRYIFAAMTEFFSCWIEDNLIFADTIV